MTKQLYIKTDGPIPEGCDYITAGKVYEVLGGPEEGSPCGLVEILDDNGFDAYPLTNVASCGEQCAYLAEGATWHFCDEHGNPVPAPWESTKRPKLCGEEGDLCACHDSPEWNVASWKIPICEHPEYSEKDGLCLRCDHARKCHDEGFYSPQGSINYRAHAEALQAENERLRKDAERYRSLRIGDIDDIAVVRGLGAMDYGMSAVIGTYSEEIDGDVLDAAIDAAMKGGGE